VNQILADEISQLHAFSQVSLIESTPHRKGLMIENAHTGTMGKRTVERIGICSAEIPHDLQIHAMPAWKLVSLERSNPEGDEVPLTHIVPPNHAQARISFHPVYFTNHR
jgi:hypothetical protein